MLGKKKKGNKLKKKNVSFDPNLNVDHDFDGKKVKVLICSGNMGNAKPDEESLHAWLPENGNCMEILEDPNYPIMFDEDDKLFEDNNEYGVVNKSVLIPKSSKKFTAQSFHMANRTSGHSMSDGGESDEESTVASKENGDYSSITKDEHKNNDDDSDDDVDNHKEQIFDIIAIGMQESTFGDTAKDGTPLNNDLTIDEPNATVRDSSYIANASTTRKPLTTQESASLRPNESTITPVTAADTPGGDGKKKKKKGGLTKKITNKTSSAVTSLTADRDYHKEGVEETDDTIILHKMIQNRLPSYKRIVSYQRGEMRLMIFVARNTCPVEVHSIKAQNTGVAGLANKGGIAAEIIANNTTRLAFVTAHLEAHEGLGKYNMRCSSVSDILGGTKEFQHPPTAPDVSLSSHFCFFMGDLNFRTRYPDHNNGVNTEKSKMSARMDVSLKIWQDLNQYDELHDALRKKDCFCGFETLYCNFPPTFKVERNSRYDYKENRTPSYTDRILWKTGHMLENQIEPLCYEPIDTFATSDHKPIRGAFEVSLHDRVVFGDDNNTGGKETARMSFGGNTGGGSSPGARRASFSKSPNSMQKRGSMIDLFSRDHGNAGGGGASNKVKEDLHLFISDIQCELKQDCTANGQPPNPYVCIISSPAECIQIIQKKKWNKFFLRLFSNLETRKTKDGRVEERTSFGWPRSEKLKATYKPDWTDKEISCILQTRRRHHSSHPKVSGSSDANNGLDLSGAILHMSVFNHSTSTSEDEWIGTFPFNLHHLLKSSKKRHEEFTKIHHDQIQAQQIVPTPRTSKSSGKRRSSFMFGALNRLTHNQSDFEGSDSGMDFINETNSNPNNSIHGDRAPPRRKSRMTKFHNNRSESPNTPNNMLVEETVAKAREAAAAAGQSTGDAAETRSDLNSDIDIGDLNTSNHARSDMTNSSNMIEGGPGSRGAHHRRRGMGSRRNSNNGLFESFRRSSSLGSFMGMFNKKSSGASSAGDLSVTDIDMDDGDDMTTIQVEGSLLRNGKETGKITCTVEAWWMDENTSKAAFHDSAALGRSSLFGVGGAMAYSSSSGPYGASSAAGGSGGRGGGGGGAPQMNTSMIVSNTGALRTSSDGTSPSDLMMTTRKLNQSQSRLRAVQRPFSTSQ